MDWEVSIMKKNSHWYVNGFVGITLLLLTGCGTQMQVTCPPTTSKKISYTEAQLAAMTPQQLTKYRDQYGVPNFMCGISG